MISAALGSSTRFLAAALLVGLVAACGGSAERDPGAATGGGGEGASGGSGSGATGNGTGTGASSTGATGSGGSTDFGACSLPGECLLLQPGCCGGCGEISLPQVEPISQSFADEFFDATCEEENPPCPDCAGFFDPAMFAWCDAGHCAEAVVQNHPVSECSSLSDCTLRAGTGCCEQCSAVGIEQLVAVNPSKEPSLSDLVCPANGGACPPCVPEYPPNVVADCQAGRCVVVELMPGG